MPSLTVNSAPVLARTSSTVAPGMSSERVSLPPARSTSNTACCQYMQKYEEQQCGRLAMGRSDAGRVASSPSSPMVTSPLPPLLRCTHKVCNNHRHTARTGKGQRAFLHNLWATVLVGVVGRDDNLRLVRGRYEVHRASHTTYEHFRDNPASQTDC